MVTFPSVESTLDKNMNPAGAVLAGWVAALPERLDNGIGGNISACTLCIAPEDIGVYWTMVSVDSWGPVGSTSGVHCHKRCIVSLDVRDRTAATTPPPMSLALALWRPTMQHTLDVKTAGRCAGRVGPEPQWRQSSTRGALVRRPKTNTKV